MPAEQSQLPILPVQRRETTERTRAQKGTSNQRKPKWEPSNSAYTKIEINL